MRFLREFEDMLEIEANTLEMTTLLSSIKEWDSMAVIEFVALADSKYDVIIAAEELGSCTDLQSLFALLER